MPVVKRQAKQIKLSILVNRELHEPSRPWPRFSTPATNLPVGISSMVSCAPKAQYLLGKRCESTLH